MRDVSVRVSANITQYQTAMTRASQSTHRFGRTLSDNVRRNEKSFNDAGMAAAAMGAAAAYGLKQVVDAASGYETAFAGVRKTVDATAGQLERLSAGLRDMSTQIPVTAVELADIAGAAGQLGVQTANIEGFTRVMADLGVATNMASTDAAKSLARLANITQMPQTEFDRLGSVVVDLGNNLATTESEIVEMGLRLAGAGKQIGLTEADVLGFAGALSSVGVEAQAGGTALSKVMIQIASEVENGGDKLAQFADVAGMSADQFSAAYRDDAAGALVEFISGLGRMEEQGGTTLGVLEELGITEVRMRDALLRASGAGDLLSDAIARGNSAWAENIALTNEAETFYATTANKIQIARNQITDLAIDLGDHALPVIAKLAESVGGMADTLGRMPEPAQQAVVGLAGMTAAAGLTGGAFLLLAPRIVATQAAMSTLGITMASVRTLAMGPWGAAAAVVAGGMVGIAANARRAADATAELNAALQTNLASGAAGDIDALREAFHQIAATETGFLGAGVDFVKQMVGMAPVAAEQAQVLADAVENLAATSPEAAYELIGLAEAEGMVRVEADGSVVALHSMGDATAMTGEQVRELLGDEVRLAQVLATGNEQLLLTEKGLRNTGSAAAATGDAVGGMAPEFDDAGSEIVETSEALQMFTDRASALSAAAQGWSGPLDAWTTAVETAGAAARDHAQAVADSTDDAADSWEDYIVEATGSLDDWRDNLDESTADQTDWRDNLVEIMRTGRTDIAAELMAMGPEGAGLVAEFADATATEFDAAVAAWDESVASSQMTGILAADMAVMEEIGRRGANATGAAIAAELDLSVNEVMRIARDYGVALAMGVNPILQGIGSDPIPHGAMSNPSRRTAMADGGFRPDAHIATTPTVLYGEPETHGEAYIPFAPGKRQRSVDIWREVGARLGVEHMEMAEGGFRSVDDVPDPPLYPRRGIVESAPKVSEHLFDEVVDWLEENLAPVLGPGIGSEAMMAALRVRFPGLALISGYRPGAITATGNPSYHGKNRAVDIPPRTDVNHWIYDNYKPTTRELIASWAGARQINNGSDYRYSGITRSMHFDHNHWAMARGGIFNPHVRDAGGPLKPGYTYNGTGRSETVLPSARGGPLQDLGAMSWHDQVGNLDELIARMEDLERAAKDAIDAAVDRLSSAERTRDEAHDRLVRMLEEEERIRSRMDDARADAARRAVAAGVRHAEEAAQAGERRDEARAAAVTRRDEARASAVARRDDARTAAVERRDDARATAVERRRAAMLAAEERYADGRARLLESRRSQLTAAPIDQRLTPDWGNTAGALTANVASQVEMFDEWTAGLNRLRRVGLSEDVIAELGLDVGPSALGQVRALLRGNLSEIRALNAAVEARISQAADRVAYETRRMVGGLGEALIGLHADLAAGIGAANKTYAAELADISAVHAKTMGDISAVYTAQRADIAEVHAKTMGDIAAVHAKTMAESRKRLRDTLKELKADLTEKLSELRADLRAIGRDTGRSHGDAIAAGMRSALPAVRRAAKDLAKAMADVQTAQAGVAAARRSADRGSSLPARYRGGKVYRTTGGHVWLRMPDASWYQATGQGQARGIEALYGPPERILPSQVGRRSGTVVDFFGGPGGLEQVIAMMQADRGATLPPGLSAVWNRTGRPEIIAPPALLASTVSHAVKVETGGLIDALAAALSTRSDGGATYLVLPDGRVLAEVVTAEQTRMDHRRRVQAGSAGWRPSVHST